MTAVVFDPDALRAWVEASCAVQGVPVLVSDPVALAGLRVLLGGQGPAEGPREGPDAGQAALQPPGGHEPGRVQGAGSRGAGQDGREVEDRAHDRRLPGQVQSVPRLA